MSKTSSFNTLQKRTDEKDLEIKKVAHKDAIMTASGELIGQCLDVFKTPEKREAYDANLAQAHLAELDKVIEIAGLSGHVHLQEYEVLLINVCNKY